MEKSWLVLPVSISLTITDDKLCQQVLGRAAALWRKQPLLPLVCRNGNAAAKSANRFRGQLLPHGDRQPLLPLLLLDDNAVPIC